jgi:hypothetical protein
MVIPRTSGENNNALINDRVSRAMAGRSHKSFFFSMRCKKDPIFQYSIIPSFSASGG